MPSARLKDAIAEANREDAEPETPEDEDGDGEEGEDEGDQAASAVPVSPAVADQDAEKQAREFDQEMQRHERALAKLMGLTEPLEPAPLDWVLGFVIPGALAPRTHEKFKPCPTCNGLGDVLTGSHKQGNETQPCPRCAGRGYLEKLTEPQPLAATPGYEAMVAPAPAAPPPPPNGPTGPQRPPVEPGMEGYGVPSWAGDPSIRPGG